MSHQALGRGAGALGRRAPAVKRLHHRGIVLLVIPATLGVSLPLIGLVPRFTVVALAMAVIGMSGGFGSIVMTAWMQERVDVRYLGRVMSLLMFFAVGLMPVSLIVSGAVAAAHVGALFVGAGALVLATGVVGMVSKATRAID